MWAILTKWFKIALIIHNPLDPHLSEIENSYDRFLIKLNRTQLKIPYIISSFSISVRKALDEEL